MVGMLYPMYASYKAIESEEKSDDTQWLMYWVCFAAFSVFETFSDYILFWLPLYYELKLVFFVILQLPQFRVAEKIYFVAVQPYMNQYSQVLDKFFEDIRKEGVGKIITFVQDLLKGKKTQTDVITKVSDSTTESIPAAADLKKKL